MKQKTHASAKLVKKSPDLTVLLPSYNESESITETIASVYEIVPGIPLIVVDDQSTDGTPELIRTLQHKYPTLILVQTPQRYGLTKSLLFGVEHVTTTYVVWLDSDGSHPVAIIPSLYSLRNSKTIVIGSSFLDLKSDTRPFFIRTYSWLINTLCRLLLRIPLTNFTSGFVLAPVTIIKKLQPRGYYGEYCIDLVTRASRNGYMVREIPMHVCDRKKGVSKTAANPRVFLSHGLRYVYTIKRLMRTE